MATRKARGVPAPLENTRRRFDRWRQRHRPKARLPEPLWAAAARMAQRYGLCRTATVLRLDYYGLKKRLGRDAAGRSKTPAAAAKIPFIELPAPTGFSAGECVVELENVAGAKMRIHLKGVEAPDLAALSQSFWRAGS